LTIKDNHQFGGFQMNDPFRFPHSEIETDLRYGIAVFVVGKFVRVEQGEFFFFTVFRLEAF